MLWEDVLKTAEKYTDDTIVLAMIRNWLIAFSIFNIFGIIIDRKFKLNITRSETDTELRTEFNISVGRWIFKRTFSISDITKKKKKESKIKKFQQKPKTSVVYIDKKEEPKTEEQSDIVIEFYEWKKRMIAKSLGLVTTG